MGLERKVGSIEDFAGNAGEFTSVTILNKAYDGKILDKLMLNESKIVKSSFIGCSIYNSEFKKCDFDKVDFSKVNMSIVTFRACDFYNVNFSEAVFKNVTFDADCKFVGCKLQNINIGDNVTGMTKDDITIISEDAEKAFEMFKNDGWEQEEDGTFIKQFNDEIHAVIYNDPETEEDYWRMTFFCGDESFYTSDFELDDTLTEAYFKQLEDHGVAITLKKCKKN